MLCEWFASTFGSWENVNSGLIGNTLGSAIGVFGAYLIASRQMRGDRAAQRQVTGATAAAEIHEKLYNVGLQLTAIKNFDARENYPERGISMRVQRAWTAALEGYGVAKFEIYQDRRGEFRFRLLAANGQTVATSKGAKNGTDAVPRAAAESSAVDTTSSKPVAVSHGSGRVVHRSPGHGADWCVCTWARSP